MDPRRTFVSAVEAGQGLEEAMTQAGVRPSPLDLDVFGVRQSRVKTTATVRTAQPKMPTPITQITDAKPTVYHAPKKQDPWNAHDVAPQTMAPRQGAREAIPAGKVKAGRRMRTALTYLMIAGSIGGAFAAARYVPAPALFYKTGTLIVESRPQGVELLLDGESQGVTPMTLKVKTGRHEVELRDGARPRVFNVFVSSGARVSQYVELRAARARVSKTSQ
jgi:PEGA domain-containing protein